MRALTDFGFRMGPFAMADLAGLDIGMRIRRAFGKRGAGGGMRSRAAAAATGRKRGAATILYEGRDGGKPDPVVEARSLGRKAAKLGIVRGGRSRRPRRFWSG